MTARTALCLALLEGKVLNIKNCFKEIGLTNCPREISRMIEAPFGVTVSRTHRTGKSRYGQPVTWTDYRLNSSEHNIEGIEKMKIFVKNEQLKSNKSTTEESFKAKKQLDLF